MSLSVSTRLLDNTIVISDVHHNTTVNSLKEDIADQCNLNVNKFNLLLEGDELIDTKLVMSYPVSGDSELVLEVAKELNIESKYLRSGCSWWSGHYIKLSSEEVTATYEICCERKSEFIGAFSNSRKPWGHSQADALTWYGSPSRKDFTFRCRVFKTFPRCQNYQPMLLTAGKWHRIEVRISQDYCKYFIDDSLVASMSPANTSDCPQEGYFGFTTYTTGYSFRNFEIHLPEGLPFRDDVDYLADHYRALRSGSSSKGCCCLVQ